jgi:hypothetical protein
LHSLDTPVGHALGIKGKKPTISATAIGRFIKRVTQQANHFKNATQKKEDYAKAEVLMKAALAESDPEAALALPRIKALSMPGNTRMWAQSTLLEFTAEQELNIEAYFTKYDPLSEGRSSASDRHEVRFMGSIL